MARDDTTTNVTQRTETGIVFQVIARQRIKVLDRILAEHALTSAQVFLLNCLLREDGQTQTELARALGIGTVAVSGMVDRLEANDWVERRSDPSDRRSKRVWLKESVTSRKQILADAHKELDVISYGGLSDSEISQLLGLMRRVRTNLHQALHQEPVSVVTQESGNG